MTGPWRDRHDPTSPKANKHWSALYAAKRRAIDRVILAEAERAIPNETPVPEPSQPQETPSVKFAVDDMRDEIARAFGRPVRPRPRS